MISVQMRNLKLNKYGNMIGGRNKSTFQGTIWRYWDMATTKAGKRSGGGYSTTGAPGL